MAGKEMTSDELTGHMMEVVSNGCTALCVAAAWQVGLFDVLSTFQEPKTSQEIAAAAKLKERYMREYVYYRYVRECLDGLVMGKLIMVTVDGPSRKYFLPEGYRKPLEGMGCMAAFLGLAAQSYKPVLECFKPDGPPGTPWADSSAGFNKISDSHFRSEQAGSFVGNFCDKVPGLKAKLEKGASFLDVGCGPGSQVRSLAEAFPNSEFTGVDLIQDSVEHARKSASDGGLKNAHFEQSDAQALPQQWRGRFDCVTSFDVIHDLPYPAKALKEIRRVLKPGGSYVMVDVYSAPDIQDRIENPMSRFNYAASLFVCMPISLNFPDGAGLGAAWGQGKAEQMAKEAGFEVIQTSNDGMTMWIVCRVPES